MEVYVIAFLVLYNVWLIAYMIIDKLSSSDGGIQNKPNVSTEILKSNDDDSIVGKSKFKMPNSKPLTAKSTPLDATDEKGEDKPEMPATFASQTEEKPSAQVADKDLDRAFSDARTESSTSSYSDDDDDYDGVPNDAYATGSTFDEIGESMETIKRDDVTPEQRRRAGKVFSELEGTALFEKIISDLPERRRVILDMIDKLYAEPQVEEKPMVKEKKFKPLTTVDEFNIRDYV